eukprot:TRINITY_DN5_c0_g1_i4.p1 TRINITY_DN5_c0_g1~~TRINITY_DN5_c0_g1_i4.p1  ORF type:complete len:158 (+),score=42.33 TRINITY_DN5_c0_g1_i4:125-598(+)
MKKGVQLILAICIASAFVATYAQDPAAGAAADPAAAPPENKFYLNSGEHLHSNESLASPNGVGILSLDDKCNLYLTYDNVLVHSWLNPDGIAQGPCKVYITKKGTLKMKSKNNKVNVIGVSSIKNAKYYQLVINNNGRLRLYAVSETWDNIPKDDDD